MDAARDGLVYLFGFPRRFEALLQGIGCEDGTGLKFSVILNGVFKVVFFADAIFFIPAWLHVVLWRPWMRAAGICAVDAAVVTMGLLYS